MKILKFIPVLLSVLLFSACGNDDEPSNDMRIEIRSQYNTVLAYDIANGQTSNMAGADYSIFADFGASTLALSVNNLMLPEADRAISFDLPAIRLQNTATGFRAEQRDALTAPANDGSTVTVTDIYVDFFYPYGATPNPIAINFTLNGKFKITTFFNSTRYSATTTSTSVTDPALDPFTTEESQYALAIDTKNMTCAIAIYNPRFVANMPSLNTMIFPGIPFKFTDNGISFKSKSLIPQIGSDPYPQFTITDLEGNIVAGKTLTMKFDCMAFQRQVAVAGKCY